MMVRRRLSIAILLFLAACKENNIEAEPELTNWFPLAVGNSWSYIITGEGMIDDSPVVLEGTDYRQVSGVNRDASGYERYQVNYETCLITHTANAGSDTAFINGSLYFRMTEDGVYQYEGATDTAGSTILAFPLEEGSSWSPNPDDPMMVYELASLNALILIPFGADTLRDQYVSRQAQQAWAYLLAHRGSLGFMEGVTGTAEMATCRSMMDFAAGALLSLDEMLGPEGPRIEYYQFEGPYRAAYCEAANKVGDICAVLGEKAAAMQDAGLELWEQQAQMQNYVAEMAYGSSYANIDDPTQKEVVNTIIYNYSRQFGTRSEASVRAAEAAAEEWVGRYQAAVEAAWGATQSIRTNLDRRYEYLGLTDMRQVQNYEAYIALRGASEVGSVTQAGGVILQELEAQVPLQAVQGYSGTIATAGGGTTGYANAAWTGFIRASEQVAARLASEAEGDIFTVVGHEYESETEALAAYIMDRAAGGVQGLRATYTGPSNTIRRLVNGSITTADIAALMSDRIYGAYDGCAEIEQRSSGESDNHFSLYLIPDVGLGRMHYYNEQGGQDYVQSDYLLVDADFQR